MLAAALLLLQACATGPEETETIDVQPSDGKSDGATTLVLNLDGGRSVHLSWLCDESHFGLPEFNGCDTVVTIDATNSQPIGTKLGTIVHRELGQDTANTYDLIRGESEYAIASDSLSSHVFDLKNTSNQTVTIKFDAKWQ